MRIQVDNTYSDGHDSRQIHELDDADIPADEDEMWDFLWEFTGDGTGENLNAYYEITILEAAEPSLVGRTREWD